MTITIYTPSGEDIRVVHGEPEPFGALEPLPSFEPPTIAEVKGLFATLRDMGHREVAIALRDKVHAASIRDHTPEELTLLEGYYTTLLQNLSDLDGTGFGVAPLAAEHHRRADLPPLREDLARVVEGKFGAFLAPEIKQEIVNDIIAAIRARRPGATPEAEPEPEQEDPAPSLLLPPPGMDEEFKPMRHPIFTDRAKPSGTSPIRIPGTSVPQSIMDHFTFGAEFTKNDAFRWVKEKGFRGQSYSSALARLKGAEYVGHSVGKSGRYQFIRDVPPEKRPIKDKALREELAELEALRAAISASDAAEAAAVAELSGALKAAA